MAGRRFGPPLDTLFVRRRVHYDAQEVASIAAICHDAIFDIFGIQSGTLKKIADEIGIEQSAAVAAAGKIAEVQSEQREGVTFFMINGEPSGGKQGVVQKLRA